MPKKIELNKEQQNLYNELVKLAKRANQRLLRLEREFGSAETWSGKRLRNKLEVNKLQAWTISSRIRVNKGMNVTQLRAILKATNQFLKSETSTLRGIKKVKQKNIKGIQKNLGIIGDIEFTEQEAQSLYDLLEEDYLKEITNYIPASDVWALIAEAKEANWTQKSFINEINNYINYGQDIDMKNILKEIYNKYVK